jgi:hypothetical protein
VHAGHGYVVETTGWEKRLGEIVARANATLEPELGARLELAGTMPWGAREGLDGLRGLLAELRKDDAGDDVDLVIGLTGSLPRLVFSFHELGMADILGKHLVLRATNDAVEYEALQKALSDLDEAERSRVYRARLVHKATCVLLHEIGHALGSPHSRGARDLMAPVYAVDTSGFADETRRLLRAALAPAAAPANPMLARATAVGAALRDSSSPAHWVPEEREQLLLHLENVRAPPGPSATHAAEASTVPSAPQTASQPAAPAPSPALRAEDRPLYEQVIAAREARNFRRALELGQPLFASYELDFIIQDLRCTLALNAGLPFAQARRECEALMRITRGGTATPSSAESR